MAGWQKQIMGELKEITEVAGLRWNAQYRVSNLGDTYIVDGFKSKLSFHFNFQSDYCTLQFYPEGVKPVGTCGFTDAKCIKNCYIPYINTRKLEELFVFFKDEVKKFKKVVDSEIQINNAELEISKMLTLSTAHIQENTAKFLSDSSNRDLVVYEKSEYGWFINLEVEDLDGILSSKRD